MDTHSDSEIRSIYQNAQTIAVLGAGTDPEKPNYRVPGYLKEQGYRIIPVNPARKGKQVHGETILSSLGEIKTPVDVLDIFRRPETLPEHLEEILALKPKVVWLQEGIENREFQSRLEAAGITVVADRCMLREHQRLFGNGA